MIKALIPLFLLLIIYSKAYTQSKSEKIKIEFIPIYAGKQIELNKTLHSLSKSGSVNFSTIKFYVGQFMIENSGQSVLLNKYYLVDVSNPESMSIDLEFDDFINYESLRFTLGVDSLTNSSGALGGDLDPTNGMYWAWQSGYINMKIEGSSDSISTKLNQFQYHLGGYLPPFESAQTIQLNVNSQKLIRLEIDFEYLLKVAFEEKYYSSMSPGIVSQYISMKAPAAFKQLK